MVHSGSKLEIVFYRSARRREPVREWLLKLDQNSRKIIGTDLRTVQIAWPLGMPLVRKLNDRLWEVRSKLRTGSARVIFMVDGRTLVLLHGFIKKAQKTPKGDLELARRRATKARR